MSDKLNLNEVRPISDVAKKENLDRFDFVISKNSEYDDITDPDLGMFSVVCSSVVVCGDYIISTNVEDTEFSMERLGSILGKAALCQYAKIISYNKEGTVVDSTEFKIKYLSSAAGYDCTNVVRRTFMFQIVK